MRHPEIVGERAALRYPNRASRRTHSAAPGSERGMTEPERTPEIEMTPEARAAVHAHLAADGRAKYVRVHVGRG